MNAMRWHPRGYGGERRAPDQVKRDGWREQGVLAVAIDDERLTWPERELVRQLGDKLYGKRAEAAMAEWTRDMVEERVEEAADVLRQLPPARGSAATSAPGPTSCAAPRRSPRSAGADALPPPTRRDQPHGGGDHLEPLP